MGMTIEDCIHKLDFFIGAYQKLIDENVANGEVVGTGVRGTWTASTPLNKAYLNMIEALQIAKDTLRKHQMMQADYENRLKADLIVILDEIKEQLREMHEDFFETEHFDEAYGVSDSMDIIQEKIENVKEGYNTHWILVKDRLPEDGTWNVFTDGKTISVERYKMDAMDHFYPSGRWFELEDAVAWMPLPKPYKAESEET